tara:strand:+ start:800 stop:1486 length:687 start_codon:yes stop_codon:yes gene_type:complete
MNLNNFEKKVYSQFNEDGIIEQIFNLIGVTNKICVEFGVQTGSECCTRYLREAHNFDCRLFDNNYENLNINLKKETLTVDNVWDVFSKNDIPEDFDLLVVDIDSYDFYVLHKILQKYNPRVLLLETNPTFLNEDKVIMLDHRLNDGAYHGASLRAWYNSLNTKFDLVCHESNGINCFFTQKGILNSDIVDNINDVDKLHRQHQHLYNYKPYDSSFKILNSEEALKLVR